jgi:hypothetical protein
MPRRTPDGKGSSGTHVAASMVFQYCEGFALEAKANENSLNRGV